MNKLLFLLGMFFFSISLLYAQDAAKTKLNADFAISAGSQQFGGHAWVSNMHFLGQKRKIGIGYGLRWNSYFGKDQNFTSAPPDLAGKDDKEGTLTLEKAQINSLSLAIFLQYNITSKLEAGFNIDALGFSFGKEQEGRYTPPGIGVGGTFNAKPTSANVLLIAANDIGSLFSDLYVRYWISPKIAIKAGYSLYFLEYTTNEEVEVLENNDRFRNNAATGNIGITWNLK